jgi:hypothetical protein
MEVHEPVDRIRGNPASVADDARSTLTHVEFKAGINQRIRGNRRIRIDEIMSETSISHEKKRYNDGLKPNRKCFLSFWWNQGTCG